MNSSTGFDRRKFLQLAAGTVAFIVGDQLLSAAELPAGLRTSTAAQLAQKLPKFEGVVVFDAASLKAMSEDFGHYIHKTPIGILLPKNSQDIQKLVAFCNQEKIKLSMRGSGGSAYGQSQVEQGFVIDSSSLKAMTWINNHTLEVQPGATWKEVLDFTIQRGLTPAVLPDTLFLTVGGTLNAGGMGETSYRLGAQVDHVESLEVVLGDGRLTACSSTQNKELYQMILAGMGQCGLITRARIKLIPAPAYASSREIKYSDLNAFMNDLYQISLREPQGAVAAHAILAQNGAWNFVISASQFIKGQQETVTPPWVQSLRGEAAAPVVKTYNEYANRNTKSYVDAVQSGAIQIPHPYLSFNVAANRMMPLLKYILTNPEAHLGVKRIAIFAQFNLNFSAPLHRLPDATIISFHIRVYRFAAQERDAEHLRMIDVMQKDLIPKILSAGGTFYLPHTPILTKQQIQQHYGPRVYYVFSEAKKNLDKNKILNMSAGIFQD